MRSTGAALAFPQTHATTNHRRRLEYNQIGAEGAAAVAEALKTNSTLTQLKCVRRALRLLPLRRTRQRTIAAVSKSTRSRTWERLRLPRRSRPTALSLRSSAFNGRCACFPSDACANIPSPQPRWHQDRAQVKANYQGSSFFRLTCVCGSALDPGCPRLVAPGRTLKM